MGVVHAKCQTGYACDNQQPTSTATEFMRPVAGASQTNHVSGCAVANGGEHDYHYTVTSLCLSCRRPVQHFQSAGPELLCPVRALPPGE
jgi:hypothetical protein